MAQTPAKKINFIGGGQMASALIGGLCIAANKQKPPRICAADISPKARAQLRKKFKIQTAASPAALPNDADIVVMAVKPQHLHAAAAQTAIAKGALLISVVAGARIKTLSSLLGGHRAVIRAMPNTPALIKAGMTAAVAAAAVSKAQREAAQAIFAAVGDFCWLKKESHIEAATAVSGGGPAYFYYLIEALEAAAASAGLSNAFARRAILQTARGAAAMVAQAAKDKNAPANLRLAVSSPAGTTERAIASLEKDAVAAAIKRAVAAAHKRAIEIGGEVDKAK
jgi:pyrroline-5-carboxylate reductase